MKKFIYLSFVFLFIFSSCTQDDEVGESYLQQELSKSNSDKKVTICHKGKETISISKNALQAHLDHGDKIGPCGYTYVPDDNFEEYLETHDEYGNPVIVGDVNSMGDGILYNDFVPTTKIELVIYLKIDGLNIVDLTGIEDFTSLETLYCFNNNLIEIDLSQNTALINLRCYSNQLASLDVSQNTALVYLYIYSNRITELDVSQNTDLKYFRCQINQLKELDLSQNTALVYFRGDTNQLTELDVSQNIDLEYLGLPNNQLMELDLSQNTALKNLRCHNNQLTELDLSQNTDLVQLFCYNNQLTCIQKGANPLTSLVTVNTGGVPIEINCGY